MPKKQQRPGPDVRRNQIIDAAIEVFGRKGYYGATTPEVSKEAGISQGTIFFYFKNKRELFMEVVKVCSRQMMETLMRGEPPQDDIRTFAKMSARNFISFIRENPLKVKILLQGLNVLEDREMKEDFRNIMEGLYQFIYSALSAGKERGAIESDVKLNTATVYILGLYFVVSNAELLDLDWFGAGDEDIFTMGDSLFDAITRRGA